MIFSLILLGFLFSCLIWLMVLGQIGMMYLFWVRGRLILCVLGMILVKLLVCLVVMLFFIILIMSLVGIWLMLMSVGLILGFPYWFTMLMMMLLGS
ncbi:hypothetical protein Ahos_1754 [Acidianus hospitalis W1]|uniref:Uncharacterized protein n=1 Tax=Acidianus hospitalis (strain W1) TaxID=933801 RepID=F4B6T8_ACIHW|nr:hypothetical protein Ahos_1754 [Acidianus hospitalis W1]